MKNLVTENTALLDDTEKCVKHQCHLIELPTLMEMSFICAIQQGLATCGY